jgi:hypothetical protein
MKAYLLKHLKPLLGRKIVDLIEDSDDGVYGFQLDNGTLVWVLCDPEGNGPGHLEIEKKK